MRPEDLSRVEALFARALDEPPEAREAFVRRACADDVALGEDVLALLRSDGDAERYFGEFAGRIQDGSMLELEASARQQLRVGPYRTLRVIGQGGMGAVYLAERADGQFDQQVALKFIRLGMDTEAAVRRFLRERQIVARLQHPHIARLLDGGVTDAGRPYFVMEYVDGVPLTRYCEEHQLSVDKRLALFQAVGEAVQYAHRNLVVHRDVKPGNVLVTAEGVVKLLDFGIAKLLAEDGDGPDGDGTRTGERALTPHYAAPEQIRGEPVTTATDVYSLGVLLYELLTGRRPIDDRPPGALERAILDEEPPRPSAVVADARLRRRLRGDLDTICLMALRKEPDRRYQSAEQLVEDVRRHLAGLPVAARKDTTGYRAAKFVRRHRVGVAAAAGFVVLTVGFSVNTALESARTARERDKAEQVASVLVDLFEVSDPSEARGENLTAREVLDRAADRIDGQLAGQPELQAALLDVIGRVYQNLGLYARAKPLLEHALALRRETMGSGHPEDVAKSLSTLGELLRLRGEYDLAEPVLREALALNRRLESGGGPGTVRSLNNLGKLLQARGQYDEAAGALSEALDLGRAKLGAQHAEVAESLNALAAVHYQKGNFAAAEPLFRDALAMRRQLLGDDHPSVPATLNNLASLLGRMGKLDEAEHAQREALAIYRRVLGAEHPRVATSVNNLALVLYAKNDFASAEPLFRESLAMRRKLLEPTHPDIAQSLSNLGLLLQEMGRYDEAEPLYRGALAVRRQAFGEAHQLVAASLNNLGLLLQARDNAPEAEALFRKSLAMLRGLFGDAHPLVAMSVHNLASLLHETGNLRGAEPLYREALALRRQVLPPGHPDVAYTLVGLGRLLTEQGDYDQAEPLLSEALSVREEALSPAHREIREAVEALATLYERWGKPESAAPLRSRLAGVVGTRH